MVKISVVISTYNRAEMLSRAIRSVLAQTFTDLELIIVDDGSIDDTQSVIAGFVKQDERIKYFWQEHSGGPSSPKNLGIKKSQGEFIAILDSDDEWMPEKLEKQLSLFEKAGDGLGFVSCGAVMVNVAGKSQKVYRIPRYKKEDIFSNILARDYMGSGSGMMYRRSVFDEVRFFDENLKSSQDREMRIRLAEKYDFDFVDEPLFKYYYSHQDNRSKVLGVEGKERDHEYIAGKHKKHYESNPKIYSNKLRYDGTRYVLHGRIKKARGSFLKSIQLNPLNLRSYFYLFLSFFGFNVYGWMVRLKARLRKNKVLDKI